PPRGERLALEVEVVDERAPGVGWKDAREDAERRRLAGAVRTEQAHDLAACDAKPDPVDGGAAAEALGELPGLDQATAACAASVVAGTRSVRNRGRTTLIHAGTSTSPPKVLKIIRRASRRPISAWNFRSENHQKRVPASMVVAVKMIALPVVAVA